MACITNHYAASDGDFFSYFFKYYKLGPLIGERTWGGVRGIRGMMPLMDGGYITRPEFSLSSLDSKWLIENRGVQPDVVVDNPPDLVKGQDPQLEKAIEMLMEQIKANPKKLPARPRRICRRIRRDRDCREAGSLPAKLAVTKLDRLRRRLIVISRIAFVRPVLSGHSKKK
jgi:C-terminal processing protease CtpA/Prc